MKLLELRGRYLGEEMVWNRHYCLGSLHNINRVVERRLEVKREVLVELQRLIPLKLRSHENSLVSE